MLGCKLECKLWCKPSKSQDRGAYPAHVAHTQESDTEAEKLVIGACTHLLRVHGCVYVCACMPPVTPNLFCGDALIIRGIQPLVGIISLQ